MQPLVIRATNRERMKLSAQTATVNHQVTMAPLILLMNLFLMNGVKLSSAGFTVEGRDQLRA